ncbi:MAG: prolipoprotein diacylglyceryl transferase [Planctomycetota bacterium]|jgi:phosphatidylglycerol:prolipoprotein diacylglycerol transferase
MNLLAESYFHTLDPFAIRITGSVGIRWYGLSYAAGFVVAWLIIRWMAKTRRCEIPAQAVGDMMFAIILGVLFGGRLGYAIFYDPWLFIDFSSDFPFWGLLAINKGGMASHGGILGVILALWLFAWRRKLSILHVLDVAALNVAPGLFFGRLANFVNGELLGRPYPVQNDPPGWTMKFPQEMRERWLSVEPQRLESLRPVVEKHLGISGTEWDATAQAIIANPQNPTADALGTANWAIARLVDMVQGGNQDVAAALRPVLTALYPSQLLQALTDGPLLMTIMVLLWLKPRRPGVIGCWFMISYGAMRIVSELYRQPDVGVPVWLGLSRGQWLSVLMIAVGFGFLAWFARHPAPKIGGLLRADGAA